MLPDLSGVDTTEAKCGVSGLQKIKQKQIIELSTIDSIFHPNHKHNVERKINNTEPDVQQKITYSTQLPGPAVLF